MPRRFRVMGNPSCQYGNQISGLRGQVWYHEGVRMYRVALETKRALEAHVDLEVLLTREA